MVRGQREVVSGRTSGVAVKPARGADQDVGRGVRRLADAEQGERGAAGEGGRVARQGVGGGLGGVQDGGEGALTVVGGTGLEEVDPGQ